MEQYTKTYDSVLVDWDGVLVRTLDIWLEAYREELHGRGHALTDRQIGAGFGAPIAMLSGLGFEAPDQMMGVIASSAIARLPDAGLYPGSVGMLERMHACEKKLALITSSGADQVGALLSRHGLARYFQSIITGDMTEYRKPHPQPLQRAMAEMHADPTSTVIIGDSESDILAARRAGIDSILFYPPEHQRFYNIGALALLKPTHTVDSLAAAGGIVCR